MHMMEKFAIALFCCAHAGIFIALFRRARINFKLPGERATPGIWQYKSVLTRSLTYIQNAQLG